MIHTWYSTDFHNLDRARVLAQLRAEPGRHLAIVRYQPDHEILEEWVYNEADIDGSKVVWARDMGAAKNQELIDYYKDRQVWLVEPDEKPVKSHALCGKRVRARSQMKFEALAVVAAVVLTAVYPQLGAAQIAKAESWLAAVARRRRLSVLLCFITALVVRVTLVAGDARTRAGISG